MEGNIMPQPKSSRFVGVKMPDVLYEDIERQCAMWTCAMRRREPHAKQKRVAQWIKEACEARLTMSKGLRIGYYALREIAEPAQEESGLSVGKPT